MASFSNHVACSQNAQRIPVAAIKSKMQQDTQDPFVLDLNPDMSLECQKSSLAFAKSYCSSDRKSHKKSSKKPSVRKKKVYWDGIDKSEIQNGSLWSMLEKVTFESLGAGEEFEELFTAAVVPGCNVNDLASAVPMQK